MNLELIEPGCRMFVGGQGFDVAEVVFLPQTFAFRLHARMAEFPFLPLVLNLDLAQLPYLIVDSETEGVVLPFVAVVAGVYNN